MRGLRVVSRMCALGGASWTWLAFLAVLSWAARVHAEPGAIVVRPFTGPNAARVRAAVIDALTRSQRATVLSNQRVDRTAHALHVTLSSAAGRAAVANELEIASFIEGRVRRRGALLELDLRVFKGKDGSPAGHTVLRERRASFVAAVRTRVLDEIDLAQQLQQPEVKPEPEPQPEPSVATDAHATEPESEPVATSDAPQSSVAFEIDAMFELGTRDFAYVDPQMKLPEQSAAATPAARLHVRWYPAASSDAALLRSLGLDAYGEFVMPLDTTSGPSTFPTSSYAYGLGVYAGLPLGAHSIGALIGYGHHSFEIANSSASENAPVPSVAYDFVRFGAEARFALADALGLSLHGAYLWLHGFGELADAGWFPHTTGGGLEADLSIGYALWPALVLSAGAGVERYFMSLHPQPGDRGVVVQRRVADGAVDQYLHASLTLGLRL